MYDRRTRISEEIKEEIKSHFNGSMFDTVIDNNVKLREAAGFGRAIGEYEKRSAGFRDYMALAGEVVAGEGVLS
ncbi:conserved hypothetical protein [uncultured Desulfobacterium sp.]|uniref:Uncharacterized protein n=1 Tax=uncultured Desulfobacterium sp. TaxID=201089 RepID=A0A445MSA6_9BACT|nr:conserved hypothetical protein [uncultured Desulfobacterium sp.]